MDEQVAIKGFPKVVLTVFQEGSTFQLCRYLDGSVGLSRDSLIMGIWEADQIAECFEELARLTRIREQPDVIMIRRSVEVSRKEIPPSLN